MAKLTDIMLLQQPEQHILTIEHTSDIKNFGRLIGESFVQLAGYLEQEGETMTDIPFAEYPAYENIDENNIHMFVGMSVARPLPGKDNIKPVTIAPRKVAVCLHRGDYQELASLYCEMVDWIKLKGFTPTGTSVEHYYTGPDTPEEEQITRIVMPLK